MDVRMPLLDGFGAARQIRQSKKIDGIPIIFLSACAEAVYFERAKEAGGDEYLVKPLDFDLLEGSIKKYLCEVVR